MDLHEHYARNARARGHAGTCALVSAVRNWPTIMSGPTCTCRVTDGEDLRYVSAVDIARSLSD